MSDQTEPGGQRLRWWQEEKSTTQPIGGVAARVEPIVEETTVVLPDVGQELEEEAMRRSVAHARGERVEIYANAAQNNRRTLKRLPIAAAIAILCVCLEAAALHLPALLFALPLFALEILLLYQWTKRLNARRTRPIVTLTKEGIEVYSLWQELGLIRWEEISEIRAYNRIYRYVGIVPRDVKALCARLPAKQTRLLRMQAGRRRRFFWRRRRFTAPINLAQQMMPITADELVNQIETFRVNNGV